MPKGILRTALMGGGGELPMEIDSISMSQVPGATAVKACLVS